jgi:hypothetical protein
VHEGFVKGEVGWRWRKILQPTSTSTLGRKDLIHPIRYLLLDVYKETMVRYLAFLNMLLDFMPYVGMLFPDKMKAWLSKPQKERTRED